MQATISEHDAISICGQVEEVIKCAICWDTPELPKLLPCQHTFCLRCIEPAHRSGVQQRTQPKDRVQCPLCRSTYHIPKRGLEDLPTDYRANVLKDIVNKKRYMQKRKFCMICTMLRRNAVGTFFCLTCCTLLCDKCCTSHRENKPYKDHLQVPILTNRTNHLLCADHPREFVQAYCRPCEQPVCPACMHHDHTGHIMVGFVDVRSTDMNTIVDIRSKINSQRITVQRQKQKLKALSGRNAAERTAIQAELEALANCQTQDPTDSLVNLSEYHELLTDQLELVNKQLDAAAIQLRDTDSTLQRVAYPLSSHGNITIATIPLTSVQRDYSRVKLPPVEMDKLTEKYQSVTNDMALLASHLQTYKRKKSVFSDIDPSDIGKNVHLLWKLDKEAYDVQFLQDGSKGIVFTAKTLDWRLHFVDFQGNLMETPEHLRQYEHCECRVVTSPVTKTLSFTYKTPGDGLHLPFVTIDSDNEKTHGSIMTLRQQVSLCSLASTRSKGTIFAFMEQTYPPQFTSLRSHSNTGQNRWSKDTGLGTGPEELGSPYYVIVDYFDRILVSDHRGCRVSVYDNSGAHLLTFPREYAAPLSLTAQGEEDDSRARPAGLCMDSHNYLYVAFPNQQVVSKFSPNGAFLEHVVWTPGKPRGISIMENRYLAVGVWGQGLCVYDLHPGGLQESRVGSQEELALEDALVPLSVDDELENDGEEEDSSQRTSSAEIDDVSDVSVDLDDTLEEIPEPEIVVPPEVRGNPGVDESLEEMEEE